VVYLEKIFLDTNILTDWVIINSEVKKKSNTDEVIKYLENFKTVREVALYSYVSLQIINSNDIIPKFRFFTSRVAIAELISNIKGRYIAEDLFRKLIPIKYMKFHKSVTNDIAKKVDDDVLYFLGNFIKSKKIKLCETVHHPTISKLILGDGIDTYDSLLISQSVAEKCNFFATSDTGIKLKNSNIKIINSFDMYNKIKNTAQIPTVKP
jgi:predicted nucleic acid-binding protein